MAIVSQLCISLPFVLRGLCEDYLTCDIAFNAVMPLSRASTHGRYSRIEGVTGAADGTFEYPVQEVSSRGTMDLLVTLGQEVNGSSPIRSGGHF